MKNSLKKNITAFFSLICVLIGSISGLFSAFKIFKPIVSQETHATNIDLYTSTNVSIFIREPAYSFFYNNKIYFIDNGDKLLKVYDINGKVFENNYKDLSAYEIKDACLNENELYLLIQKEITETSSTKTINTVVKINLESNIFETTEFDTQISLDPKYDIFNVTNVSLLDDSSDVQSAKDYSLFTFSSSTIGEKSKIILLNDSLSPVTASPIDINFDNNDNTANLIKTLSCVDVNGKGKVYLLFVYKSKIIYYPVNYLNSLTILAQENQTIPENGFEIPSNSARLSQRENITEAMITSFNEKDYLAITFKDLDDNNECLRLYSFNLAGGTADEKRSFVLEVECINSNFGIINGNCFAYPDKANQALNYITFTSSNGANKALPIQNPECEIDYLSVDEFVYKKAKRVTELFENPWGASSDIAIGIDANVVKIGTAHLLNGTQISDYDYCMYTNSNGNNFGYIKNEYLDLLPQISVREAGYKVIKDENGIERAKASIWANSSLYSLPTTFCKGKIGKSNLVTETIMQIEENSLVEILDVLGGYTANNVKMLKVKINDNQVGYIEARCVRNPVDTVDFVITNATIKNDGTKVYLSASSDATALPFTLNSGKTVRINGKRNTKTGFTSITFNDEYGNEFTGFIETDYIKADTWSTLQILGCILIAINIGLLILILIFKKNHLGSHGQKVSEDEVITK